MTNRPKSVPDVDAGRAHWRRVAKQRRDQIAVLERECNSWRDAAATLYDAFVAAEQVVEPPLRPFLQLSAKRRGNDFSARLATLDELNKSPNSTA